MALPSEAGEAEEAAPTIPGFSGDQLQRLRALRAWLERRKEERLDGGIIEPRLKAPRQITAHSDRQLLTPLGQRYALGFQKNRRNGVDGEPPTLHIGRGSDGRIRHRYVFRDAEQAEAEPENPAPVEIADSRQAAASRQRIVRIWMPESPDQRSAPRLDYELPDQRR